MMREPAQKILVHKYIDWQRVEERLIRYKNIGSNYNIAEFKKSADKPPYYCHYLAWRLGTWNNEDFFKYYDQLLGVGAALDNWSSMENLLISPEFPVFWGLLWQLQVAKFFSDIQGVDLVWLTQGPDLKITVQNEHFFVECYTYQKSFGIEEFIGELFGQIHPKLKIDRMPYVQFSLPKNKDRNNFLNELFRPFLDPHFIQEKSNEAQTEYPVMLPVPEGSKNFYVYMEGDDPSNCVSGRNASGDPEEYLILAIREACNNKKNENKLKGMHPNILAVNFLLGGDFEAAEDRHLELYGAAISPCLDEAFDGVLFDFCGIDKTLSPEKIILNIKSEKHPIRLLLPGT